VIDAASDNIAERRRFMLAAARAGLAAALLGGAAVLVQRGRSACASESPCQACSAFGRCDLPRALAARRDAAALKGR